MYSCECHSHQRPLVKPVDVLYQSIYCIDVLKVGHLMNDLEPNWVTLWPLTSALDDAIDPFKSINETRCQSMTIMLSWPLWSWLSWRKKVFFITLVKIMSIYVYFLAVGLTYLLNYASVILALVSFIRIHDYMYFQRQLTLTSSIFQFKELFDWNAFTFSFFIE